MELIPIFPRYLGINQFNDIPKDIISKWKAYIEKQPSSNYNLDSDHSNDLLTENQKLLEDPIFYKLKSQILSSSKKYLHNTGFEVEDVQISNSWGYITGLGNTDYNFHSHSNSLISGVFYLTEGSPLLFKTDLHRNASYKTSLNSPHQIPFSYYEVYPQTGLLVLFPSHLEHSVLKNNKDIKRISIAFNIIPKGEFGSIFQKLYL
jgi:uncharacterized protein (TIGR02466 family)